MKATIRIELYVEVDQDKIQRYYDEYPVLAEYDKHDWTQTLGRECIATIEFQGLGKPVSLNGKDIK